MSKKNQIILAEDNLADVELIKLALGDANAELELLHVSDGNALVELVKTADLNAVRVVIMDLNMPKMSGIEVLKQFYDNPDWRRLPVIIFSSSVHISGIETCYEFGANAYVCKPLDMGEFTRCIQSIISFWADFNVAPTFHPNTDSVSG